MRRFVCLAAFLAGTAACYLNLGEDDDHGGGGSHTPYTGPLASVPGELPCDVASAIKLCQACHGPTPSGGAPVALATYADLTAAMKDHVLASGEVIGLGQAPPATTP